MKVCIISEGSYPIVRGGVSEWAHQFIKKLGYIDFDVFCLAPSGQERQIYEKLPNVDIVKICGITPPSSPRKSSTLQKAASVELANCLSPVLYGNPVNCENMANLLQEHSITKAWLRSKEYWDSVVQFYKKNCPETEFSKFFWTVHGIYSMLLDTLALVPQLPKADVYHSLTTGMGGLIGSMAKVLHGSPLVIAEHGLYLKERNIEIARQDISATAKQLVMAGYKTMVRTSYQYANLLVPICRSHADAELELGASRDKIRIITNGINCDKFTPPPSKNGAAPVVGCFARVVPVKDIITLIRASQKVLEKQTARFAVIGEIQDDEYYNECQALVQKFGLGENFSFIGHVDKVIEWYHQVDVFALCSQSEGVPLALLEAMSCGLPSVCTAVGGVPDILSGTGAGYIVPPNDPDSLAARLCELLENKTLRREMGVRARELAREKYTIENMADRILGVYLEALLNGSSLR